MVIKHYLDDYENFRKFIDNFDCKGKPVYVYFGGSKENGASWCDDCERANPVIEKEIQKLDADSHFVYVQVGDRPTWKDPNCPFRKDPQINLLVLPTMLKWGGPQRLEGEQCENPDLLSMLFTDEEED